MLLVAIPVFALALFFLLLAWLSGHRTLIPMAVRPAWFYFPGLLLLAVTAAIMLVPSAVAWNRCNNECAITGDLEVEYDRCIRSSSSSIGKDMLARNEDWTDADVERYLEEHADEIADQCAVGISSRCVQECFDLWRDPEMFATEDEAAVN